MKRPSTDPREIAIGLRYYGTDTPGIGGELKLEPHFFKVDEIAHYPVPRPDGRTTIARIESYDIEQNELIQRLGAALGIPPSSIGFAGTKDRRALTTQLVSLDVPEERLRGLTLSGVRVLESYRADDALFLGYLYGNLFELTVSRVHLSEEEVLQRTEATILELKEAGGFPNYFGPQRFGEIRPVTHLVGRALVRESVEAAVQVYLTASCEGENLEGAQARREYAEHHDPERALKDYPRNLKFERVLLDRLSRGNSPERAFRALPRHLKTLFVHAYQSYLFNEYLSQRLEEGLSLDVPVVGDMLQRYGPEGLPGNLPPVPVTADNFPEVEKMVLSGRARVAAPLVGRDTPMLEGDPGRILEKVVEREGVQRAQFQLPDLPRLSSAGTYRSLLARLPYYFFRGRVTPRGEDAYTLRFPLDKGVYATVLLREFMKERA
ncbi:MAG: tRNA pseudouridine(13) synthase TruD [Candidatus Thermoplasmatota archaeon]|nr:tRNA pseudouridine(13) synthase TruD [Candidatus Thermoplasmatota archaeon]